MNNTCSWHREGGREGELGDELPLFLFERAIIFLSYSGYGKAFQRKGRENNEGVLRCFLAMEGNGVCVCVCREREREREREGGRERE